MKRFKLLLFTLLITTVVFTSCNVVIEERINREIVVENIISNYDLWYVDYHRTTGTGDIPFLSRAFTISFFNGRMYANNNIVDIGRTGNGLGALVGSYNTVNGFLNTNHSLDGRFSFEVYELSANEIEIYNPYEDVSYYLIGYPVNTFDYDKLFYENIEYFLQEYVAWEKVKTSISGKFNAFDRENFLQFTPENNTTFYSSQDNSGTHIDSINWDYVGDYEVYDVQNYNDLKVLTLYYDNKNTEEFELSVITDEKIQLYHVRSKTTYIFKGRAFIPYLKTDKNNENVSNDSRKRTKVKRKVKVKKDS